MTEAVRIAEPSRVEREIEHEQRVVDKVHARLEAAAESARQLAAEGHARARLGNEGGLVERDAIVFQAARRLAALDAAQDGLVFGRLDLVTGDTRYIGRLGLRDADREPLLVDWRAPAASVFYQATAEEPSGVVRRRVLRSRRGTVLGLEDELLDAEHAGDDLVIVGEGALIAALSRTRSDRMHSVVATIQREQDLAIRSPHRGVTEISGGPGTGKTVVALHRVAYLLYTDRRRYESGGVLVVGPNAVFMSYIERVLPSLGETAVSLRALGEVVDGVAAVRHDPPDVAVVKGSELMQRVLARTVKGPVPGAPTSFRMFYRDDVLRLDEHRLASLRRRLINAAGGRRNRASSRVFDELASALWEQIGGGRAFERGREALDRELRGSSEFVEFCRAWWPPLDGVDVLGWLADPGRLAHDAAGVLAPAEIDRLAAGGFGSDVSVEDVPLVDELRYLLGEAAAPFDEPDDDPLADLTDDDFPELTTAAERIDGNRPTGSIDDDAYAHVLVDEAQDLSPMQWRMLGRRGRGATWTIVGDAAQSAWPLPRQSAAARAEALRGKQTHGFRLSTNYRNSREVFDLAARYAHAHLPQADLPTAVRAAGADPVVHRVGRARLAETVRDAVGVIRRQLGVRHAEQEGTGGTLAVITPVDLTSRVTDWLTGGRDDVRILTALDSKGLEFDAVVVVEPDQIVDESPAGAGALYVALTRATRLLHIVSTTVRWESAP